jgi:nucleoside-diphosphate-sugar epimerase
LKKILITGGSGFLGTNLVEHYLNKNFDVLNLDLNPPRNSEQLKFWKKVDLLDKDNLSKSIKIFRPDIVFHMAARTDLDGETLSDYSQNFIGTENLINALNKTDSVRFTVFASSMLVCKLGYLPNGEEDYCPDTIYGESKVRSEQLIRAAEKKFKWIIVRPTSIWGPWFDRPYKDFFTTIQNGFYFHIKNSKIKRSYGFVKNTVFQLESLETSNLDVINGKTAYLADYQPIELREWANLIQENLELRPIRELPILIFKILAIFGDFLKILGIKNPPLTSFRLKNMQTEMIHDTSILKSTCPKLPYSHSEGVQITCNWLNNP